MKVGFFIGRFQPAHTGHLQALLDMHSTGIQHIIIGVGSAQKEWTEENPFTYTEIKNILERLLQDVPFSYEIFPVPDVGDDEQRFNYVTTNLPHFDVVLSGNPRLEGIFKPKGYEMFIPTITVEIKGTNTRKAIALGDKAYIEKAINNAVYQYLLDIKAPTRLQQLMPGLQSYKVQYTCILDNGDVITVDGVPYKSAHEQIIEYVQAHNSHTIIINNTTPLYTEKRDEKNNLYIVSITFYGEIQD